MPNAEAVALEFVNGNGSFTRLPSRPPGGCLRRTGCMANGAMKVYERFKSEMAKLGRACGPGAPRRSRQTMRSGSPRADARASARWGRWSRWSRTASCTPRCASEDVRRDRAADVDREPGRGAASVQGPDDPQELPRFYRTIPFTRAKSAWCCASAASSIRRTLTSTCSMAAIAAAKKAFVEMSPEADLQDHH